MSTLTLHLPDRIAEELARASRESHRSTEHVAIELIEFALMTSRFESTRRAVIEGLGTDAPRSDDDALGEIS